MYNHLKLRIIVFLLLQNGPLKGLFKFLHFNQPFYGRGRQGCLHCCSFNNTARCQTIPDTGPCSDFSNANKLIKYASCREKVFKI